MSRAKHPIVHTHDQDLWRENVAPRIETRPIITRRMMPKDYQRHQELVLEARRKSGSKIKKPLY